MATNSYVQAIVDAQIDAKTLEECINGAPDVQVRPRLARMYWTLATINNKVSGVALRAEQINNYFDGVVNATNTLSLIHI